MDNYILKEEEKEKKLDFNKNQTPEEMDIGVWDNKHNKDATISSEKTNKNDDNSSIITKKEESGIELSKFKKNIIFLALVIVQTLSSLDATVVATTIPKISSEFNSYGSYTWIITAYMITNTAFQPMYGKFSSIFGCRSIILTTITIFTVASLLCGVSNSINMLIISRTLQGIGGGGNFAMINIIISIIYSIEERGFYLGITASCYAFASIVGPFVGGLFTDYLSWRWAFYINIPLGIITFAILFMLIKIPMEKSSFKEKIKRIDFFGTIFVVCSLISLLLALNWGGITYAWSSPLIIILFCLFVIFLIAFVYVELMVASEPITPMDIFKYRNMTLSCICNFCQGFISLTISNTIPLLYQNGRALSATSSGLRFIPTSVTLSIGSIISGILIGKYGHMEKYIKVNGLILIPFTLLITYIGIDTSYYYEFLVYLVYGATTGIIYQTCVLFCQQSAPEKYLAISTSVVAFFQTIGGVVGVAFYGTIQQNLFQNYYTNDYPEAHDISIERLGDMPEGREIYVDSVQDTYLYTVVPISVVLFVFSMFMKHIGMKKLGESKAKDSDTVVVTIDSSSK